MFPFRPSTSSAASLGGVRDGIELIDGENANCGRFRFADMMTSGRDRDVPRNSMKYFESEHGLKLLIASDGNLRRTLGKCRQTSSSWLKLSAIKSSRWIRVPNLHLMTTVITRLAIHSLGWEGSCLRECVNWILLCDARRVVESQTKLSQFPKP